MSTVYTANAGIGKPSAGDSGWAATLNAAFDRIDQYIGPLAVQPAENPSASLNVKVAAGVYQKNAGTVGTYAGTSSFALTASSTNYLWLTESGTLTTSTSGWPSAGTYVVRLGVVVTGSASITSITPWNLIPRSVSA